MTQEEKITNGLDKELMQLIDAEMNDPVLGKLLNRNAAYVLGKEIKLVLIERACEWLQHNVYRFYWTNCTQQEHGVYIDKLLEQLKQSMRQ